MGTVFFQKCFSLFWLLSVELGEICGNVHTVRHGNDNVAQKCALLCACDTEVFVGLFLVPKDVGEHVFKLGAEIVICHGDGKASLLHIKKRYYIFERNYVFRDSDKYKIGYLVGVILLFLRGRDNTFLDVITYHRRRYVRTAHRCQKSVYIFYHLLEIQTHVWQFGISRQSEVRQGLTKLLFDFCHPNCFVPDLQNQ